MASASNSVTPTDVPSDHSPLTSAIPPTNKETVSASTTSIADDADTSKTELSIKKVNEEDEQNPSDPSPKPSECADDDEDSVFSSDKPLDYSLKGIASMKEKVHENTQRADDDEDSVFSSDKPLDYSLKGIASTKEKVHENTQPSRSNAQTTEGSSASPQAHNEVYLFGDVDLGAGAVGGVDASVASSPGFHWDHSKISTPHPLSGKRGKSPSAKKSPREFFGPSLLTPRWPRAKTPKVESEKTMKQFEDNYFTAVVTFSIYPAVFRAGDMVHGTVQIANKVGIPCTSITFFCQAMLEVDTSRFHTEPGTKPYDGEFNVRRNKNNTKTFIKRLVYTDDVMAWLPKAGEEPELPPGFHTLHFAFVIPANARPSTIERYFVLYYKIMMGFSFMDGREFIRYFDMAIFTVQPLPALTSMAAKDRHRDPFAVGRYVSLPNKDNIPKSKVTIQLPSSVLELPSTPMVRIMVPYAMTRIGQDFLIYPKLIQHLAVDIEAETYYIRRTIHSAVPNIRPEPTDRNGTYIYPFELAIKDFIPSTINAKFPFHDLVRVYYTLEVEVRVNGARRKLISQPMVVIQRLVEGQLPVEDPTPVVTCGDENRMTTYGAMFKQKTLDNKYYYPEDDQTRTNPREIVNSLLERLVDKRLVIMPTIEIKVPSSKPKFKFTKSVFYSTGATQDISDRSDIIDIDSSIYKMLNERRKREETMLRQYFPDLLQEDLFLSDSSFSESEETESSEFTSSDSDSDYDFLPTPLGECEVIMEKPQSERLKSKREKIRLGQYYQNKEEQRKSQANDQNAKSSPESDGIPRLVLSKVKDAHSEGRRETNRWECFSRLPRVTVSAPLNNESPEKDPQNDKFAGTGARPKAKQSNSQNQNSQQRDSDNFAGTGARPKVKTATSQNASAQQTNSRSKTTGLASQNQGSPGGQSDHSIDSQSPKLTKNQRKKQRKAAKKLQEREQNEENEKVEIQEKTTQDTSEACQPIMHSMEDETDLTENPIGADRLMATVKLVERLTEKLLHGDTLAKKNKTEKKTDTSGIPNVSPSQCPTDMKKTGDETGNAPTNLKDEKTEKTPVKVRTETQGVEGDIRKSPRKNATLAHQAKDSDGKTNTENVDHFTSATDNKTNKATENERVNQASATEDHAEHITVNEPLNNPASSNRSNATKQPIEKETTGQSVTQSEHITNNNMGQNETELSVPTVSSTLKEIDNDVSDETEQCPRTNTNTLDKIASEGSEQITSSSCQQETSTTNEVEQFTENVLLNQEREKHLNAPMIEDVSMNTEEESDTLKVKPDAPLGSTAISATNQPSLENEPISEDTPGEQGKPCNLTNDQNSPADPQPKPQTTDKSKDSDISQPKPQTADISKESDISQPKPQTADISKDSDISQPKPQTADISNDSDISQPKPQTTDISKDSDILQPKPQAADISKDSDISQPKPQTADISKDSDILQPKPQTADISKDSDISQPKPQTTDKSKDSDISDSKSQTTDKSTEGDVSDSKSTSDSKSQTTDKSKEGDVSDSKSQTTDKSKEGDVSDSKSQTTDKSKEGDVSDSKSQTTDKLKEGDVSDSKSQTTDKLKEGDVSDSKSQTTDKLKESDVSDSKSQTTDKLKEGDVSDSKSQTTDKLKEGDVSDSKSQTTDKLKEGDVSDSKSQTTDKLKESDVSDSKSQTTDKLKEGDVSDSKSQTTDKLKEGDVSDSKSQTTDKLKEGDVSDSKSQTTHKLKEGDISDSKSQTTDKLKEGDVSDSKSQTTDKSKEGDVSDSKPQTTDKLKEGDVSDSKSQTTDKLKDSDVSDSKPQTTNKSKEGDVSDLRAEATDKTKDGDVSDSQPETTDISKEGDVSDSQPEITDKSKDSDVSDSKPQTTDKSKDSDVSDSKPQTTDKSKDSDVSDSKPQTTDKSKDGDVSDSKPQTTDKSKDGDVSDSKPQTTDKSKDGDVSDSKPQTTDKSKDSDVSDSKPQTTDKSKDDDVTDSKPQTTDKSKAGDVSDSNPQTTDKSKDGDVSDSKPQTTDKSKDGDVLDSKPQTTDKSKDGDVSDSKPQTTDKSKDGDVSDSKPQTTDKSKDGDVSDSKPQTTDISKEGDVSDSMAGTRKKPRRVRIADRFRCNVPPRSERSGFDSEDDSAGGRSMNTPTSSRGAAGNSVSMTTRTDQSPQDSSSSNENSKQTTNEKSKDNELLTYCLTKANYPNVFTSNVLKANNGEDINDLGRSLPEEINTRNLLIEKCLHKLMFEGGTYYGKQSDKNILEGKTYYGKQSDTKTDIPKGLCERNMDKRFKDKNILYDLSSLKLTSEHHLQKSNENSHQKIDNSDTFYLKQNNIIKAPFLKTLNEISRPMNTGSHTHMSTSAPRWPINCPKDKNHVLLFEKPHTRNETSIHYQTQHCGYFFVDQVRTDDAKQTYRPWDTIETVDSENEVNCVSQQECCKCQRGGYENTSGKRGLLRNELLPFHVEMPHRSGWNPQMCTNIFLQHSGLRCHKDKHIWAMDTDVVGDPEAVLSKPSFNRKPTVSRNQSAMKDQTMSLNSRNEKLKQVFTLNSLRPITSTFNETGDEYKSLKRKVRWYSNMMMTLKSHLKSSGWDYEKYNRLGLLQDEVDELKSQIKLIENKMISRIDRSQSLIKLRE